MSNMTQNEVEKYNRLKKRLRELEEINEKIGKLAFFVNSIDFTRITEADKRNDYERQLTYMGYYRDYLQKRIEKGSY